MKVEAGALKQAIAAILMSAGCPQSEAETVSAHLVEADMRGHTSHGSSMMPIYLRNLKTGTLRAGQRARWLNEPNGTILVFDGGAGFGQAVALDVTEQLITSVKSGAGLAIATLRNVHHIGRVGTYAERACADGVIWIGFVSVNSGPPKVAPFGGSDGRLGTCPLCIGVPYADGPPIILDFATSAVALGRIRVAKSEGRQVQEGLLIDSHGQPTTDPNVMYSEPLGALLSMGGHKGYGLALVCEILGGALGGGGTIQPGNSRERGVLNGITMIGIDPARMIDVNWYSKEIRALVEWVKASPPANPAAPVLVPGEPERAKFARHGKSGVEFSSNTWAEIRIAARSLGIETDSIEQVLLQKSN